MAFDFSTLPKHRAYSYMGKLGDPDGCSIWNPLTYPTCSTWLIQAGTELQEAHTAIIDLAYAWQLGIQDIQSWPESTEKSEALSAANAGYEQARQILTLDTQMMNEWNQKVQPWRNIGLAGLPSSGLGRVGRLGIAPLVAWGLIGVTSLAISALAAWNISAALSAKSAYDSNAALYNSQSNYNTECGNLLKQGKSCYGLVKPDGTPTTPWGSNLAMVAGVAMVGLVALFFLKNK